MNEFEIIRRYFESKNLPVSVKLGVGDDGAIIHNDPAKNLVVATDTLVSGVHFPLILLHAILVIAQSL